MTQVEDKTVSGCHFESWGLCLVKNDSPSKSSIELVDSQSAIEGPPSKVKERVCLVSTSPDFQKNCSHFQSRTTVDQQRDVNI